MDDRTFAVLMAGGSGTRFWPLSRRRRPKQVLPFAGGASLVRAAFERATRVIPPERVLVVTGADQAEALREALPGVPADGFLVEPAPRNTAPCLGLAAVTAERRVRGALLLNLPADHVIEPAVAFEETAVRALRRADEAGTLVTFGIAPTRPATGYGWIRLGEERVPGIHAVARFTEKPDAATAAAFLAGGGYRWNGGLFAWRADAFLGEVRRHLPALAEGLDAIASDPARLGEFFPGLPEVSVDYGVMERTGRAEVCLADFRWDDVGSFEALARLLPADAAGNHPIGEHVGLSGGGHVVVAPPGHLVATIGCEGLVVVATGDVTLVVPRERAEEVGRLVKELRLRGREDLL